LQKRLLWIIGVAAVLSGVVVYAVFVHHSPFSGLAKTAPVTMPSETGSSRTCQLAVNPQFDASAPFTNGLAAVRVGD